MNKRCQKQNLKAFEKYHQQIEVNSEQPKIGEVKLSNDISDRMKIRPIITMNVVMTGHHFIICIAPLMGVVEVLDLDLVDQITLQCPVLRI